MGNQTYPKFNLKTIILPMIPSDAPLSIEEYKERTGIDLRDIIGIVDNHIYIKVKGIIILDCTDEFAKFVDAICGGLGHISNTVAVAWDSGVTDGSLFLAAEGQYPEAGLYGVGITFFISKNEDFTLDNMTIFCSEL